MPKLGISRLKTEYSDIPNLTDVVHVALREEALKLANLYAHLGQYVIDPTDLITFLPLGTYVEYEYMIHVDNVIRMLEQINLVQVEGVHELIWAISGVLRSVLIDFERISSLKPNNH